MGSTAIPMMGVSPQLPNAGDLALKAMSLRQMMGSQQIQEQQLQALQMENQQRAQDLEDQALMRQAYLEGGGDLSKTMQIMMQKGASPKAIAGIQQSQIAMQTNLAKLSSDQLTNLKSRNDILAGAGQAFLQDPNRAQPGYWSDFLTKQLRDGALTSDEYKTTLQAHPDYPGDQQMQLYIAGHRTATQAMEDALKQQQIEAARAEEARKAGLYPSQLTEAQDKAQAAGLTQASNNLLAAAQKGPQAYKAVRDALPTALGEQFPPSVFDANGNLLPDATDRLNNPAMTPQQRETEAHRHVEEQQRTQQIAEQSRRTDILAQRAAAAAAAAGDKQDAADQKAYDAIAKTKQTQEANLMKQRVAEINKGLGGASGTGYTSEEDVLASNPTNAYSQTQKQKALDIIKRVNNKYAPRLQHVQDNYANAIRQRGGTVDADYDVNPDTLEYTERPMDEVARPEGGPPINPITMRPPQGPPARTAPTGAAAPPPTPQRSAKTYTEAEVRQRATAAGKDPDQAVALARQRKLIQ